MVFIEVDPNNPKDVDKLLATANALIRFHSPGCGHCLAMGDEMKKVSEHPKINDLGMKIIDIESSMTPKIKHKSARIKKQGVPTIVYVSKGSPECKEHTGARKADAMADFIIAESGMTAAAAGGGRKRKRMKKRSKSRKKSKKIVSIRRRPIIKGTRNIRNKRLIKKKKGPTKDVAIIRKKTYKAKLTVHCKSYCSICK